MDDKFVGFQLEYTNPASRSNSNKDLTNVRNLHLLKKESLHCVGGNAVRGGLLVHVSDVSDRRPVVGTSAMCLAST